MFPKSRAPRPRLRFEGFPPAVRLIGIGWYFAACIVVGVVGGLALDNALDLKPALTLVGLALGMFFAFWGGYRMLVDTLGGLGGSSKEGKG